MLENNTDRSYFMIGAMVIAGILVAAAAFIFSDVILAEGGMIDNLFASLNGAAEDAVGGIPGSTPGE